MPFKKVADEHDYPERLLRRKPWDEWGPQEQARNLRKALGEDVFMMLEQAISDEHGCQYQAPLPDNQWFVFLEVRMTKFTCEKCGGLCELTINCDLEGHAPYRCPAADYMEAEWVRNDENEQTVEADVRNLCKTCEGIGRNDKHSYFCRKCSAPLN